MTHFKQRLQDAITLQDAALKEFQKARGAQAGVRLDDPSYYKLMWQSQKAGDYFYAARTYAERLQRFDTSQTGTQGGGQNGLPVP